MAGKKLGPFLLLVAAWLVPLYLIWWLAIGLFAWPVALLSELVARVGFGDLVRAVEQHDKLITFVTSLRPSDPSLSTATRAVLEVPSDYRLFSFGLPMLAALTLAARDGRHGRKLMIAYLLLVPFQTFSVVADFLKNVAIESGPAVAAQLGFAPWQREAIIFSYQFGTLIMPTVVPAIIWVLMHRHFLETLSGRDKR
jgi:hypothetical protein